MKTSMNTLKTTHLFNSIVEIYDYILAKRTYNNETDI